MSPSAIVATKTDIFKTNLSNQIKETSSLNLSLVLQKRAQQMGRCWPFGKWRRYLLKFISPASHTRLLIAESCRSWNSSIENLATVSRCVSSDQNKYSQPKCDLLPNLHSSIFIPVSYSGWNKQGWSCKRLQNQNQKLVCSFKGRSIDGWHHGSTERCDIRTLWS